MGLITQGLNLLFGDGRNVLRETAEVFSENRDKASDRAARMQRAALEQFGAEFALARKGLFDRLIDGLNRLPRPGLALGTLGLFVSAMVSPDWFSARMVGLALVPEPLWWLLGAIVSFYFGARHQAKGYEFQEKVFRNIAPSITEPEAESAVGDNPALDEWRDHKLAPRY